MKGALVTAKYLAGRVALSIEELVVGVERNREETSRVPFEGVLFTVLLPDRSCPMSVENVDHLLVKMLLLF